ncbi:MAG: hypothetical protein PHW95_02610 [Patescibacteria group bacterium]|nr:hypothetical protein [Patescibacteria group bacterium]
MSPTTSPQPTPMTKPMNIWVIISIVLAIALIGVSVYAFGPLKSTKGDNMVVKSSDQASSDLISFINQVYGAQVGNATLKSTTEKSGLYEIALSISTNGQPTDQTVYVTKDGKYFIPQVIDIADVTKQFQTYQQQQQQGGANVNANVNAVNTNANVNVDTNANTNTAPSPTQPDPTK